MSELSREWWGSHDNLRVGTATSPVASALSLDQTMAGGDRATSGVTLLLALLLALIVHRRHYVYPDTLKMLPVSCVKIHCRSSSVDNMPYFFYVARAALPRDKGQMYPVILKMVPIPM